MPGTQPFSIEDAAAYPYVAGAPGPTGTNEVQTITITGTPTGGTFTLTFDSATTAAIPYNATASAVQTALEALSSIGVGNVAAAGGPLPGAAVTVTFQGALGSTNVDLMTADGAALTGGTTPAVAVTETTAGTTGSKVDLVGVKSIEQSLAVDTQENRGDGGVLATAATLGSVDLTVTLAAYTPVSVAACAGGVVSSSGSGATAVTRLRRKVDDVVPYFGLIGQTHAKDADGGAFRITYPKVGWQGGPDFSLADNAFAEISIKAKAIPDEGKVLYDHEAFATWTALA